MTDMFYRIWAVVFFFVFGVEFVVCDKIYCSFAVLRFCVL